MFPLLVSPAAGAPLCEGSLSVALSCRLFSRAKQGLEQVGGGSAISVVKGTGSLEYRMGLVLRCVPLAKWSKHRRGSRVAWGELRLAVDCFMAALVQPCG